MTTEIKSKLNGGIELLATAMRKVFDENMAATREALKEDLSETEGRLNDHIDKRADHLEKRIDTTNENMQEQFAEQEKKLGKLISEGRA